MADVVAALPKVLRRLGIDARVVMPLYGQVDRAAHGIQPDGNACVHMGASVEHWIGVHRALLDREVPVWLVDFDAYYGRPGIYHASGHEFLDNGHRFALLSKAALQLCKDRDFVPDVMHVHDWPTALAAVFLKTWDRVHSPLSTCASVLTIHNIGYQGKVTADVFPYLGVGDELFSPDVFEDYGRVNLLKGGIHFADAVTTVSPTHLQEIMDPSGGHGMAPYLTRRQGDVAGILNGVDYEHWDPATDPLLPFCYGPEDLSGKAECKLALQRFFNLPERSDLPLFGLVTRLAVQKGIDLLREALPAALDALPMQFVLLGTGDPGYERFFSWLGWSHRDSAGCHIGYSEELAHLVEAGSDFFLMPSLYEPCGLNQIYSMKYGTLPVVRATGGLRDTVDDYDEATGSGTGFTFQDPTAQALLATLRRVTDTWFERPTHIASMQQEAMTRDFSWDRSARQYIEVYRQAMRRRRSLGTRDR